MIDIHSIPLKIIEFSLQYGRIFHLGLQKSFSKFRSSSMSIDLICCAHLSDGLHLQAQKVLLFKIVGENRNLVKQYESDNTARDARFRLFPHSLATFERDSVQQLSIAGVELV
jgi:hypothetical protein